jgi:uncharacterized protein (DUF58 family)
MKFKIPGWKREIVSERAAAPKRDVRDLIKKISDVELYTKIYVEGLQSGQHRSVFKGQGIEFTDIREYVPGDDVRAIDWNVTARLNHPYVKEFTEERDQTFYLVPDYSGSGSFGSVTPKSERMIEICASIGFAAIKNNDRVGLCIFTDRVEKFIPAGRGRKHLIRILNTMTDFVPESKGTDISPVISFLSKTVKRKSSVILISDFYAEGYQKPLKIMKGRHEVIAVRLTDPRESELPDVGLIELEDPETGEQILIDTSDESVRLRFENSVKEADEKVLNSFKRCRIGCVDLKTTDRYDIVLKKFFSGEIKRGV